MKLNRQPTRRCAGRRRTWTRFQPLAARVVAERCETSQWSRESPYAPLVSRFVVSKSRGRAAGRSSSQDAPGRTFPRSSPTCEIGLAGKHRSAAHGLRVRRKIAYHELIPVTAGGVVVGITVRIEAAKTTKASTKATAFETTAAETAVVHSEPAASETAVAHRKPVTSEAAAHGVTSEAAADGVTSEAAAHGVTSEAAADGVTSEAAAHGVTSAAKATAAMSAPAASMSAPATKRHSAGGHSHAEGSVAAAISFFRIEVSPYSGSDLPRIENVWLRCRANELLISHEQNSLTLRKKNAALHLSEHRRAFALLLAAKSHTFFP